MCLNHQVSCSNKCRVRDSDRLRGLPWYEFFLLVKVSRRTSCHNSCISFCIAETGFMGVNETATVFGIPDTSCILSKIDAKFDHLSLYTDKICCICTGKGCSHKVRGNRSLILSPAKSFIRNKRCEGRTSPK
ncbi:hypothetical protein NPIL_186461 [Nephila pilipes]|uniref:Uncharacterized protein n=1 Tax=Nephila pilipes TaxID=299642 RepID=A0A8X6MNJ9_NEPPI|nr:hypothetical protein NPIL_186461 [Nephila pilipes]